MHKPIVLITLLSAFAAPLWAADQPTPAAPPGAPNPFSEKSKLPYELPLFDVIKDADFEPAFEAGLPEVFNERDVVGQVVDRTGDFFRAIGRNIVGHAN